MMPWNPSLFRFFHFNLSSFPFFWNLLPFLYFLIFYGFFVFFPYFSPMQPTTSPAIATNNVHLFNVLLIKYPPYLQSWGPSPNLLYPIPQSPQTTPIPQSPYTKPHYPLLFCACTCAGLTPPCPM